MANEHEIQFEHISSSRRLKSMMRTDFRRMFTSRLFYIMAGICFILPVLILVMTTMSAGTVTVDPNTGEETVMASFENAWQIIGSVSGSGSGMSMDLTSMCNINMIYFAAAILVCLFVAEDFRSGYVKNLFTVRAKRSEYITSKTLLCCICGAVMILMFFIGAMIGGKVSGLSFDLGSVSVINIIMCMLAKIFLVGVFVPIALCSAVLAKSRTWLGILIACFAGMLLYMTIPMMTPLNASIGHAGMCLAGSAMFSLGIGAVSKMMLNKEDVI